MADDNPDAAEQAGSEFESRLSAVADSYGDLFKAAEGEHALREARAKVTGPEGELTQVLKLMRSVPKDKRREFGQRANALKEQVESAFSTALDAEQVRARQEELSGAPIDVTLPGRRPPPGRLHALTRVQDELIDIFSSLGFEVAEGPEVEHHAINFDKLGFPPDHPATDMQDSFFVKADEGGQLLRTHTSTVQVRQMLGRTPPLAVVSPGAVYRRDDDITHSPMFHQLEGLLVDRDVSFAELKGTLQLFVQRLFGDHVGIRLRPSYFPFVEPGAEMDVACPFCEPWLKDQKRIESCRVCKASGWIEILGCGMVHPVVFEAVGYDPEEVTGFAFGLGIDRIAMLLHGIPNIRLLYDNDVRFLSSM